MRGIVCCMACGHHQSWIGHGLGRTAVARCRKCDRWNRFNPRSTRWTSGEKRGRKAAVWFRPRPEWMPRRALAIEARERNGFDDRVHESGFTRGDHLES